MATESELGRTIDSIEQQAERKKTSENLEDRVTTARAKARSVNSDLQSLADAVEVLQFYREVLNCIVDPDSEPESVSNALEEAAEAVQEGHDEYADLLVNDVKDSNAADVGQLQTRIKAATTSVESAIEDVKSELRQHRSEWEKKLSSARELQKIIGAGSEEFTTTVGWIETIVSTKIWEPSNSATAVCTEWENAIEQWRQHQELQDLSSFKKTHNLSDKTVDALKRLDSRSNLTLANVDLDVLEEMKRIDELSEAVELQI